MISQRCALVFQPLLLGLALASLGSQGTALAQTPAPVISQPADGASFSSSVITVSGRAIANSFIEVLDGGERIATAVSSASGNWSTQSFFRTGTHTLTATAFDLAGGGEESPESGPHTIAVDVGIVPPAIASPTQNQTLNRADVTVLGQADLGTTVTLTTGGATIGTTPASATTGNWEIELAFAEGSHSIVAVASDTTTPSATRTFTIDTTAPAAPTIGAPAANSYFNTPNVTSNGTRESGATVELLLNSTTPVTVSPGAGTSWSKSLRELSEGTHILEAHQVDAAGNAGPKAPERVFAVDLTVPTAEISTLTPVFVDTVTVNGDAHDNLVVDRIVVSYDGPTTVSEIAACSGCPGADVTWTSTRSDLAQGAYTVTAIAVDKAGNSSAAASTTVVRVLP